MPQLKDPATRRTLFVAAGVTALLAVAVAVAATRGPEKPAPRAAGGSNPSTETSSGAPGETFGDASGTAAPGSTGAGQGDDGASGNKTLQSAPRVPTAPAAAGSRLATLSAPPAKTIGMISVPDDFRVARFSVSFKPFGWGPNGPDGGRLVALVTKSEPLDDAAKALDRDFSGRNASLWCSPTAASSIRLGGSYTGVIEVRRQSGAAMLFLQEVKVAE